MGAQTRDRLQKLLEKLKFGNAFAIRADVLEEVQSFLTMLDDISVSWADNALGLWASLIALGGQLEANDAALASGRSELDCLKAEERAALQTALAIGSNFVRSFPDTKDLDDAYTAYNRTKVPVASLLSLINGAVDQKLLTPTSSTLINDVARLADGQGTQANKAHGVTVTGMSNLVTVAAIAGTVASSGLIAGATGKVGSDIVDHYEISAKAIGFLDTMGEEIAELINGLPPDEKAAVRSYLRDRVTKQLEQ